MRIIGGQFKGRNLHSPKTKATRPTSARAREALFSILQSHIAGARILDLFAGTGAFGFEALSRGAEFCCFIDHKTARLINQNAADLAINSQCMILPQPIEKIGSCKDEAFDIIFADPPYGKGLGEAAFQHSLDGGWANEDTIFILEESVRSTITPLPALQETDRRQYSDTQFIFFMHAQIK